MKLTLKFQKKENSIINCSLNILNLKVIEKGE